MSETQKSRLIDNLRLFEEPFEVPRQTSARVVGFGTKKRYEKPTFMLDGKSQGKIRSIQEVVEFFPTNGDAVELIWNIEGAVVIVMRVHSKPLVKHHSGNLPIAWAAQASATLFRNSDPAVKVEEPIEVTFDNTSRPPLDLLTHFRNMMKSGDYLL